jgi:hypothetical protein
MKSIFRYGVLLAVMAVLAFSPALNTKAQGSCLPGLSADDCKLIADSEAQKVTSFAIDSWTLKLDVKGTTTGDVSVDAKGSGAIDFSEVKPVAGKPESVAAGLKFVMTLEGTSTAAGKTDGGTGEIRIVDGVMYVKSDKTEWQKTDFAKVLAQSSSSGSSMGLDPMALSKTFADPQVAGLLQALLTVDGFIGTEAGDGPAVGDAATRQITVNVNLGALLTAVTTDKLPPSLSTMLKAANMDASTLTMVAGLLGPTLNSAKIGVVRYVGTGDKMLHGIGLNFAVTIDPQLMSMAGGMAGGMGGGSATAAPQGPISISFTFDAKLTKINEPVSVEAVADAKEMTTGSLSMPGLPSLPGSK